MGTSSDVGYLNLGNVVVLVPGGLASARRKLLEALTEQDWQRAAEGFGDPNLTSE